MSKKIMIVDDSITIRQQVSFVLSRSEFQVIEAVDGSDGLNKLRENPDLSLVITDINMPNMTGLEMLEAIKDDGAINHVPIVVLTTEGSAELIERAKKAKAKGWLVKPFKPDQLMGIVGKLVN